MQRKKNKAFHRSGISNFLLSMACFLPLLSCVPEPLDVVQVPTVAPEIVVATQIIPDESLLILLTRTFSALEASDDSDPEALLEKIAVNDAVVTISGNGGVDTLSFLENGFYGGVDIDFKAGETYTMHVKSASLGEVYASTTVKPRVEFQNIHARLYYDAYNDTITEITYSFRDAVQSNWYMINVQEIEQEKFIENIINPRIYTRLLLDTAFNGQTYAEKISVFARNYEQGDTIAVLLSNISEDYYAFMKLRHDNRYNFMDFLGEPINYPSNVKGGKGFFNLYIPDTRTFVFGQRQRGN